MLCSSTQTEPGDASVRGEKERKSKWKATDGFLILWVRAFSGIPFGKVRRWADPDNWQPRDRQCTVWSSIVKDGPIHDEAV